MLAVQPSSSKPLLGLSTSYHYVAQLVSFNLVASYRVFTSQPHNWVASCQLTIPLEQGLLPKVRPQYDTTNPILKDPLVFAYSELLQGSISQHKANRLGLARPLSKLTRLVHRQLTARYIGQTSFAASYLYSRLTPSSQLASIMLTSLHRKPSSNQLVLPAHTHRATQLNTRCKELDQKVSNNLAKVLPSYYGLHLSRLPLTALLYQTRSYLLRRPAADQGTGQHYTVHKQLYRLLVARAY